MARARSFDTGVCMIVAGLLLAPACDRRETRMQLHTSGAVHTEEEWLGRALDGRRVVRAPDGALALETHYSNGLRHGPWRAWFPDGKPQSEGVFERGMRVGPWKEWWPNGALLSEGVFERGFKIGAWRFWNDRGEPLSEERWEDGTLVGARQPPVARAGASEPR